MTEARAKFELRHEATVEDALAVTYLFLRGINLWTK